MSTSRVGRALLAAVLASVVVSGCGFPAEDHARPLSEDDVPVGLRPGMTATSTTAVEAERVTIWLVDGERLVDVRHDVAAPATIESVTTELLTGANENEQERGLRSALPDPGVVAGSEVSRGVATVELTSAFLEISPEDQLLAVGQLVLTLTDLPGVGSVQFTIEGSPAAVPLSTGESSEVPVFREQFLTLSEQSTTS